MGRTGTLPAAKIVVAPTQTELLLAALSNRSVEFRGQFIMSLKVGYLRRVGGANHALLTQGGPFPYNKRYCRKQEDV